MTITPTFTPTLKQVTCTFQGPRDATQKTCEITIADGMNCQSSKRGSKTNTVISGDTVSININNLIRDADKGRSLCYNLTARAGPKEVILQDFIKVMIISENNALVPIIVTLVIVVIVLVILIAIIVSFMVDRVQYSYNIIIYAGLYRALLYYIPEIL